MPAMLIPGREALFDSLAAAVEAGAAAERDRIDTILKLPGAGDMPQVAFDLAFGTYHSPAEAKAIMQIVAADRRGAPASVDADGKPLTRNPE